MARFQGEMPLGMVALILFLVALIPVLVIGAALVELLLGDAPRRGKRPDNRAPVTPPLPTVRVLTADGHLFQGTPAQVVRRLAHHDLPDLPPGRVTQDRARELLLRWESEGYLIVRIEWS